MKRIRPSLIVVLVGAACLVAFVFSAYRELTYVETGENVPSVSWLPATASNVSFYRSYPMKAYEFDIDEPAFIALAEVKGWKVWRFEDGAKRIQNHVWCRNPVSPPSSVPAEASENDLLAAQAKLEAYGKATTKLITNGYWFEKRIHNGGTTEVAYDAIAQRAYVYLTMR